MINLIEYTKSIDTIGLEKTWDNILEDFLYTDNSIYISDSLGELYEIGLAHLDKIEKKELGKYFTPNDVATVMAQYFIDLSGSGIADVGCGTGNLVMAVLRSLDRNMVDNLIKNKKIILYDIDPIAVKIAIHRIAKEFDTLALNSIESKIGDFLDKHTNINVDYKVISNPPYGQVSNIPSNWSSSVLHNNKELYTRFIEKIISQSIASVIITPHSFMHASVYYPLRLKLSEKSGKIFSFDNVPGNIFNGRKHGIFNTNNANSVRAAITITDNQKEKGYLISSFIRFKNNERELILNQDYLEKQLSLKKQVLGDNQKIFYKVDGQLEDLQKTWFNRANNYKVAHLLSNGISTYSCYIPNTCRYFTVCSYNRLRRAGQATLNAKDENARILLYALFNSSFAYWYYRMCDGGIVYPTSLMYNIPLINIPIESELWIKLKAVVTQMNHKEAEYYVYKTNAGNVQQNIKFPDEFRRNLNSIFLEFLGFSDLLYLLETIHKNSVSE